MSLEVVVVVVVVMVMVMDEDEEEEELCWRSKGREAGKEMVASACE
jgi:hypothetical protein